MSNTHLWNHINKGDITFETQKESITRHCAYVCLFKVVITRGCVFELWCECVPVCVFLCLQFYLFLLGLFYTTAFFLASRWWRVCMLPLDARQGSKCVVNNNVRAIFISWTLTRCLKKKLLFLFYSPADGRECVCSPQRFFLTKQGFISWLHACAACRWIWIFSSAPCNASNCTSTCASRKGGKHSRSPRSTKRFFVVCEHE